MNDDQTASRTDAHFPAEFEAVVEKYEAQLLRYTARLVADPDAAQDVVQNTFIKLSIHW